MTAVARATLDLLTFHSGRAVFAFDGEGFSHIENVVTVEMEKGETIEAFVRRLRSSYDWRKGDTLELLNNGGKLNVARLTRQPR